MRSIAVVTVGRSDYGIYLPILREIKKDPELQLLLIAAGMHLSPEFGLTVNEIEKDGFKIDTRVEIAYASDTPQGIADSMGQAVASFGKALGRLHPDFLLVLGDRFEMHAAALAALPFRIPVAHVHGGEITEGAFDDSLRHSMTKLSHLHFTATETYAQRVRQMGEEPWRVMVTGAPGLDALHATALIPREELGRRLDLSLTPDLLLVTFHPVTLESEQTENHIKELLKALEGIKGPILFTAPNADTNHRVISRYIETFLQKHPRAKMISNLGTEMYFSLMAVAGAMIGNSSSGLLEAPSFELPVVNIGIRQKGRLRAENVIDVASTHQEILDGIHKALSPQFRASLKGLSNPYGKGHAAPAIVRHLKEAAINDRLLIKRFIDEKARDYAPANV